MESRWRRVLRFDVEGAVAIRDNKGLAEQADAISDYVDILLTDLWQPEAPAVSTIPAAIDPETAAEAVTPMALEAETIVSAGAEPPRPPSRRAEEIKVVEESDATRLEDSAGVVSVTAPVSRASDSIQKACPGPLLPTWADEAFQVLIFEVNGLTMGVPLISLVSILKWDGDASAMPGQPAWQLGMLTHHGHFVTVVETASLLMPERPVMREKSESGYLLLIGDGRYGLLVDAICSTRRVRRDEVHWQTGKRRPWLVGTLVEPISALLEVEAILGMFDE